MRIAALCCLSLLGPLSAGCASLADGAWTMTAAPAEEDIVTENFTYALELDASVTSWTGRYEGTTPRRVTLEYAWTGAHGLRASVGKGDASLQCAPGEPGVAGEGDGYAWTIQPLADGCKISLVLVTRKTTPEDPSWRIDGWTDDATIIRAALDVAAHPS